MAKKSAADKLVDRINTDIDRVYAVTNYVGADGSEKLTARIDADLARLLGMRDYVSAATTPGTADGQAATKPKRTRGKNKDKPVTQVSASGRTSSGVVTHVPAATEPTQ